jgi:hypothetical protein
MMAVMDEVIIAPEGVTVRGAAAGGFFAHPATAAQAVTASSSRLSISDCPARVLRALAEESKHARGAGFRRNTGDVVTHRTLEKKDIRGSGRRI